MSATTYPARFAEEVGSVADLPTDAAGDETLCLWGEPSCANDNAIRAQRAAVALKAYAQVTGGLTSEPVETVIADMLSDFMHLCDAVLDEEGEEHIDFDSAVDNAYRHYTAEFKGEF